MSGSCCNLVSIDWQQVVQSVKPQHRSQTKVIVPLGPSTESVTVLENLIDIGAQLFLIENQSNVERSVINLMRASANKQQQIICVLIQVGGGCSSNVANVLQDSSAAMQGVEEGGGGSILGKRKATGPQFLRHNDIKNLQTVMALIDIPYVVLSHCRNVRDVQHVKDDLEELGLHATRTIWKIDNWQILHGNFRECVEAVDGILIDREALGSEWEKETQNIIKLPLIQKKIIKVCNFAGKPVLINGVADSLKTFLRPTRAEATDIANNVLDGVDGIVLGAETAEGMYPKNVFQAVQSMCKEAEEIFDNHSYTEQIDDYLQKTNYKKISFPVKLGIQSTSITPSTSIENIAVQNGKFNQQINYNKTFQQKLNFSNLNGACYAAVKTSNLSKIDAIILAVGDDRGIEQLSQLKPKCPIIVFISNSNQYDQYENQEVSKQLLASRICMYWGTQVVFVDENVIKNCDVKDVCNVVGQKFGQKFQRLVSILRDNAGNHLIKFNFDWEMSGQC
eukprot:TRINITY_DN9735_c0_g2_i1.p1 TRINITY_DN9735_c0_g2~~TRINITY_DN9735_c0_g2_i1.p1  ORF type:complete len:519 (-),score=61.36 TRINITY_DN9735_c0_g2_i1:90-1610(-)